jgi:hypothetical protein
MVCHPITREPPGGFERYFIFQLLIKGANAPAPLLYGYVSKPLYSNQDNLKA